MQHLYNRLRLGIRAYLILNKNQLVKVPDKLGTFAFPPVISKRHAKQSKQTITTTYNDTTSVLAQEHRKMLPHGDGKRGHSLQTL